MMGITKKRQEKKLTSREYHIQKNEDTEQQYVKMYCNTKQFTELTFCGLHNKPHIARRLSKHYHVRFDPKLEHGTCAILIITFECSQWTSALYKTWNTGVPPHLKLHYQPVKIAHTGLC